MAGHGEKLSRKQEEAIAALLSEPTLCAAATRAGVSDRTLRTWIGSGGEFSVAYKAARLELVAQTLSALQNTNGEAVETLRRNLSCGEAAVEIRSAKTIIELSVKLKESQEFGDRLSEIESSMRNKR